MSKYYSLYEYLTKRGDNELYLTYAQIEAILGFTLPPSAYNYPAFWRGVATHVWVKAINEAGYYVSQSNIRDHFVILKKGQKTESIKMMEKTMKQSKTAHFDNSKKVILLNKEFLGGWLDNEGNIGHEIIDFLLTDKNEYYVYNNPWGVCPSNIWVEGTTGLRRQSYEKYDAKYLLLTSSSHDKNFEILYVIELAEKLHRYHTKKDINDKVFINDKDNLKAFIRENAIQYNGKLLNEIYGRDQSLLITFKGKKIYRAIEPIKIDKLSYNFQRNKGYVYSDKYPTDYQVLIENIESSFKNGNLEELKLMNVNSNSIKSVESKPTFMDLIQMQNNEQAYTNMLFTILSYGDTFIHFCERFKKNHFFVDNEQFKVLREKRLIMAGWMFALSVRLSE